MTDMPGPIAVLGTPMFCDMGFFPSVLIVEPMGLGKLYGNVRNYLTLWPFGYARK